MILCMSKMVVGSGVCPLAVHFRMKSGDIEEVVDRVKSLKSEIRKINNSTFSIKKRDPDEIFPGTVKAISRDFLSLFNEPSKKNNNTFTVEYLIFVNYSLEVPQYATYSALQSWKFSLQYKILKDKTFIQENLSIIRQDRHESDSN